LVIAEMILPASYSTGAKNWSLNRSLGSTSTTNI